MRTDTATISLCSVRVADELFGFDILKVYEALGERVVQPVPLAPEFVAGVVPYRGEVLAVLSLRSLLGLPPRARPPSVLVVQDEREDELFGLAVDALGDVLSVATADFVENPRALDAQRKALFAGAYKLRDGLVIYLKPELLWPMRLMEQLGNGPGRKI